MIIVCEVCCCCWYRHTRKSLIRRRPKCSTAGRRTICTGKTDELQLGIKKDSRLPAGRNCNPRNRSRISMLLDDAKTKSPLLSVSFNPKLSLSQYRQGKHEKYPKQDKAYLTVNNGLGEVELADHAKWDGTTTWLGIVQLTFEEDSVDSLLLSEDLGSTGTGGSTTDNSDLVLHLEWGGRLGGIPGDIGLSHESRWSEGGDSSQTAEGKNSKLHLLRLYT